jgi:hypothetical protein
MKALLYSIFVLLLAPCNNSSKAIYSIQENYSDVLITYQRTACFGNCPIYKLTINGKTNTATFYGEQHTKKTGSYHKPISTYELKELIDLFDKQKFNSLNDNYLGEIVDLPINIITYQYKGKTKTVQERSVAPEALITIEKKLSEFAEGEGWIKD